MTDKKPKYQESIESFFPEKEASEIISFVNGLVPDNPDEIMNVYKSSPKEIETKAKEFFGDSLGNG